MVNDKNSDDILYDLNVDELKYIMDNVTSGHVSGNPGKQLEENALHYYVMLYVVDQSLKYYLKKYPEYKDDKQTQNQVIKAVLTELRKNYLLTLQKAIKTKDNSGDLEVLLIQEKSLINPHLDMHNLHPYLIAHFAHILGYTYKFDEEQFDNGIKIEKVIGNCGEDRVGNSVQVDNLSLARVDDQYMVLLDTEKSLFDEMCKEIELQNKNQPR